MQLLSNNMKRILRDLNCNNLEQLEQHSLYFLKDLLAHRGKVLIQDDAIISFWEWNVNVFASRCKKFWEALDKLAPMADVKYLWLVQYRQLLNFENMSKLLLLFPNITHVILALGKDIPIHTIRQIHSTYFKHKFSLIIAENNVIFINNRFGYITYQVCKQEQSK